MISWGRKSDLVTTKATCPGDGCTQNGLQHLESQEFILLVWGGKGGISPLSQLIFHGLLLVYSKVPPKNSENNTSHSNTTLPCQHF